jgi:GT2 family glycosyltransferase
VSSYAAIIATFRRPESLRGVLEGLARQTHPPALVVVADNDPDASARGVVDAFAATTSTEVVYVEVGDNRGPAGGWAAAARTAEAHEARGDWLVVMDDDDGVSEPSLMATHMRHASEHAQGARVAAVGLRGAVVRKPSGRLMGASRDEPSNVDYLASNGAPAYRWQAVADVGFFDAALFFGFEDLDLGLRLRAAGWSLVAHPLPHLHEVASTSPVRVAWREYYKTRSLVVIGRRHVGVMFTFVFLARSVLLGGCVLAVRERSLGLAVARLQGAYDAMRGRLGVRRFDPSSNPAKRAPT